MDDDEDFDLQPLDGCDDDDDVDAKNVDTFAEGGSLGDDWQPDASALGAFEALRIATQQQGLQGRDRRQQQAAPPSSHLRQKEQEDEVACRSVYATHPLLQPSPPQQQGFAGQEQQQQQVRVRHEERLWQQSVQQQQRAQPQPAEPQLQQSQQLQPALTRQQQRQLHRQTGAAGAAEAAGVQQARGPVGNRFQSSSRSTVTEQLNRLIAFKRQQHQQQAPSAWLLSTSDAIAPATTASTAAPAGAGVTAAAPAAVPGATAAAVAPRGNTAAGTSFTATSSSDGQAGSFDEHRDIVGRPLADTCGFGVRPGLSSSCAAGAASAAGNVFAAGASSAAAAAPRESSLIPAAAVTDGAAATAEARGDVAGAAGFLTSRAPPGLQLQQLSVPSAATEQQQQLLYNMTEAQSPQLLVEREDLAAAGAASSAMARALSPRTTGATGAVAAAPAVCGPSAVAPAVAGMSAAPPPGPGVGGDIGTEDEEGNMLLVLKNLNLTAALAALDAVGISAAGSGVSPEAATAAGASGLRQLQQQLREQLEPPRQHVRAEPFQQPQLQQELQQRHLKQEVQERQKHGFQQPRQQQQEFLLQEQQRAGFAREKQERLQRQQQRLLQFLRPGGDGCGAAESAAGGVASLRKDAGSAAAAAGRPPESAAGTAIAAVAYGREQLQQQDTEMPAAAAAEQLSWRDVFPSGRPQLQQQQLQQHRQARDQQQQEPVQERQVRQPVTPLVSLQSSQATGECASTVVGSAAAPGEPPLGRTQQQQQMPHQLGQPYGSTSRNTTLHEGGGAEKKVFTEAEVLQMLTAANRRSNIEPTSASLAQPTRVAHPQGPPFSTAQRFHQQQEPLQQQHAQGEQMQEPRVLQQRLQARQQQYQAQHRTGQQQQEQHTQELRPERPPQTQNVHPQPQQQQADAAWLRSGQCAPQQLREDLYTSSVKGGPEEDGRRRQQLQQPPLRPQQQCSKPTLPQQQQQLQQPPEAQQRVRCSLLVGKDMNDDQSRDSAAGGAATAAHGVRGRAAGTGGEKVLASAVKTAGGWKAAAPAGKAASPVPAKGPAAARLQGPLAGAFTASSSAPVPVADAPVPPSRDAAGGTMQSAAEVRANEPVGGEGGGRAAVLGDPRASGDAGGEFARAAGGEAVSRAASALAAIRASHLFPLTKAHREMAVKQHLPELVPWRLPPHLRSSQGSATTGMPTPRAFSRSSSGSKGDMLRKGRSKQTLMTASDLEYILRLQLTSMAKLPQLQLVSGRWNFRFLRSESTVSAGTCNSRTRSPSRGDSGSAAVDQPLQRKPVLPSLPVEMEQHLLHLLTRQQTPSQQVAKLDAGTASNVQSGLTRDTVVVTPAAAREADLPLLPAVLERKLHGGVGITVVDGSTRMHRMLLGSITLQEATNLLEPLQQRQGSARRDEAAALEELVQKETVTNWLTPSASPGGAASMNVDVRLLEPLEEENIGEKDASFEMAEGQQQRERQQNAAKERELRRLQKRFGKQTYCSVRQPRSSIYVGGGAAALAAVEDDSGCDEDDAAAELWGGMPRSRRAAACAAGDRGREAVDGADVGQQQQQQGLVGSENRLIAAPAAASGGSADDKARRKLLRSLVLEGSASGRGATRGAAAESLLGLTVVEDAFDLLLQAAALEDELLECPASHVTARERLVEQQQHLLLQLFELLLLRRHVRPAHVSDGMLLYLVDFHPPASVADVEVYVRLFERQLQQQENLRQVLRTVEQQQQVPQQLLHLQETERLQQEVERLQQEAAQLEATLAADIAEGRCYSRWMLSRVYSRYKGRQLLLRSLLLLPEPQAAALVQALCSSPSILYSLCVAVDAALVPADQLNGQQQQQRVGSVSAGAGNTAEASRAGRFASEGAARLSVVADGIAPALGNRGIEGDNKQLSFGPGEEEEVESRARRLTVASAALLEELVLLLEVEVEGSRDPTNRKRPLIQRLRDVKNEEPFAAAAEVYVQLIQLLLRLGSTTGPRSNHFITSVAQHLLWGVGVEDVVKILEWRSGCCFFSSVVALLPHPETLTPLQHKVLQDCLKLVVSALLMTVSSREGLPASAAERRKRQNRHSVLAPLIQTIVQQARPYECRAKIITTTAVQLLGVEGAQEALSAFLQGHCL